MKIMLNLRNRIYDILRWSEKYTQADMIYLAKGNFWQILGQIVTSILGLGLTVIFANLLPKETYGTYRYILSVAGILSVFTLNGMNQAVSQAVAVGKDGALRASIKYQLRWNAMQFLAFVILGTYYFFNENVQLATSLWIMSVFSPLAAVFNIYGAYLSGKREFRLNNIFSIISTAIYVVGMAVAIILKGEVVFLVIAYSLSTMGSALTFYLITLHKFKPSTSNNNEVGDVLKYGRELTLINFISPVTSQIDKIILAHFWGATQLAVYSLATAIPEKANSFIKGWVHVGMPKFSTKTPEEMNTVFYKRIFQGLFIGIVCTLGYIILAPHVFNYLLPKYLDALLYSQILSVGLMFSMPNRYIGLLMASQKLSWLIFVNNIIQSVIKAISYIIFGILGGVLGLILANVFNSFIAMIINIFIWRNATKPR